jgi:signal transduction histidine kinase
LFLAHIALLSFLVTSRAFVKMVVTGLVLTWSMWRLGGRPIPSGGLHTLGYVAVGGLTLFVLFFGRRMEQHADYKVHLSKVLSNAIAHETKTPLTIAMGLSYIDWENMKRIKPVKNAQGEEQYILTKAQYQQFYKNFHSVHDAVVDINKEIEQFRGMVGKEISTLDKARVSLKELLTHTVANLSQHVTRRVKVKITTKKDFQAVMARAVFPNILTNFIKNAYTHGSASELHIEIDGDKRQVRLRDNGRGIPTEVVPKIFNFRFTTREGNNSGVGLSLVKLIFDALGVQIETKSKQGPDSFTEFVWMFGAE